MLKLMSCAPSETGAMIAMYELQSAASKTEPSFKAMIQMKIAATGAEVSLLQGDPVSAETEDAALTVLAQQLDAAAKALRQRGEPKLGVPIYG